MNVNKLAATIVQLFLVLAFVLAGIGMFGKFIQGTDAGFYALAGYSLLAAIGWLVVFFAIAATAQWFRRRSIESACNKGK
ncbi:hypothetical protein Y5S_03389 [Alcanivorax nanhaiticus]|jgi:uncharacterized membrane protein|uniref:Uncharacterized protein n=1 Tax=Alcanivorax nanhaiticus TaxID=1177154 RepID=A0A095TLR7_9GAMM|nr:hypothetical protein [Alcanivorax nanhaiticus]KGD63403.1 hypothetical protein Y5S_03389 [Alcanivorax nanhaiticus]OUW25972.1 MAG: hypothetical protein CBD27_08605 [Rhodospirillaceae bacterium TMED167]|tara:strand:- start:5500 stop:5739 length:240 start_codon:yes stop_codon:yes gene_type:complete